MSLVKGMIEQLVEKGKVYNTFTIKGTRFEMEPLETEEQLLADGLVDISMLTKKYGAEKNINVLPDMVSKFRTLAQITFAIKKVNGVSPVDENADSAKQFEQRMEFRDELLKLGPPVLDELIKNYKQVVEKQKAFFDDFEENAKKSSTTPSGE